MSNVSDDPVEEDPDARTISVKDPITIWVRDQTGEETLYKMKRNTPMSKVFAAFAARKGVDKESLRFTIDCDRIKPHETPAMMELEGGA